MWYLYIMKNKNIEKFEKFIEDIAYESGRSLEDIGAFKEVWDVIEDGIKDEEVQSRIQRATDNGYQL